MIQIIIVQNRLLLSFSNFGESFLGEFI